MWKELSETAERPVAHRNPRRTKTWAPGTKPCDARCQRTAPHGFAENEAGTCPSHPPPTYTTSFRNGPVEQANHDAAPVRRL